MTYPVSLLTLRTRVRQRADIENATARFPDAELNDSINQGVARWYDRVRKATWAGQTYFKSYNFVTTNGVSLYALPSDFVDVDSIDVYLTPGQSNQVISAKPYQVEDRNIFRYYGTSWNLAYPIFYRILGQNISFIGTPSGSYNVALNYVPTAPTLASDGDTIDSINGWEEAIVLMATTKCAFKDENFELMAACNAQLEGEWARIDQAAATRDEGFAEVVHDVTGYGSYGDF